GRYLLDSVRMQVGIGDASYWFFVIAWAMLLFGALRLAGAWLDEGAFVFESGGPAVLVAVTCFLLARALGALADHAMDEAFSEFWLEHQQELRIGIRTAHEHARENRSRIDLAALREQLSRTGPGTR